MAGRPRLHAQFAHLPADEYKKAVNRMFSRLNYYKRVAAEKERKNEVRAGILAYTIEELEKALAIRKMTDERTKDEKNL